MTAWTYWNGTAWGTISGALLVELQLAGGDVTGKLALLESGQGQTRAKIVGKLVDGQLNCTLSEFDVAYNIPVEMPAVGHFEARLVDNNARIEGTWTTDRGGAGGLVLVPGARIEPPHLEVLQPNASKQGGTQSQPLGALFTTTLIVGALRMGRTDVSDLARLVKEGTKVDEPAINAAHNGREFIHLGFKSLSEDPGIPKIVETVLVSANEQAIQVGTNVVTVALRGAGLNTIYVSGYDRTWVEGKARRIETFLNIHQSRLVSFWRTYGENVNGVLALSLLAVLPSIPRLVDRFKFVFAVFSLLWILALTWRKVANTRVFLRDDYVPFQERYVDWIVGALATGSGAVVAYLVQRFVHPHS